MQENIWIISQCKKWFSIVLGVIFSF